MPFHLAVICGGPSQERGISLNSARSILDHLGSDTIQIHPVYVDTRLNFYRLSPSQLYSNTPSDFDFKLQETAQHLDAAQLKTTLQAMDMVFPAIHGAFGETGELQALLEAMEVPFVGSGSAACQRLFYKHKATEVLTQHGFGTIPAGLLQANNPENRGIIERFFRTHNASRAIIKPTAGGSSIGVHSVATPAEALEKAQLIFDSKIDNQALLEPFIEGKEFTVLVFQHPDGQPVALIPSFIEVAYSDHGLFDYRRKYLPTSNTRYHTPAPFGDSTLQLIQQEAEAIFTLFGMQDFGRIDGWLRPDGSLLFTDINPISGMEQNSFVFRQGSLVGLSHKQVLQYIVESACRRNGRPLPGCMSTHKKEDTKHPVYVLFGGSTAERQTSLMSGTNVWLKLLRSNHYAPTPFFWAPDESIWPIPYSYALNHTTDEIFDNCQKAASHLAQSQDLAKKVHAKAQGHLPTYQEETAPQPMSLDAFLKKAKADGAFVFIALHGGIGEDGRLQSRLEDLNIPFNGPGSTASALCMDKLATGKAIEAAALPHLLTMLKASYPLPELIKHQNTLWATLRTRLQAESLIVKPQHDGCSAGITRLQSQAELGIYIDYLAQGSSSIPAGTFEGQKNPLELPSNPHTDYLFEPYLETDTIVMCEHKLTRTVRNGWIELTVGVLESKGNYRALPPSITVAEGPILSLEEKFQGGTGVNLTPPPLSILAAEDVKNIQDLVAQAAQILGIKNYSRLDVFYHAGKQDMILIEANTLPALTPSTVLYHQALADTPSKSPIAFLEYLIDSAKQEMAVVT